MFWLIIINKWPRREHRYRQHRILQQFVSVENVTYPNIYQRFLDGVKVLNFDLSWILSVGCVFDIDFHDRLLLTTLGPIATVGVLGVTFSVAVLQHRGSHGALTNVRQKHASAVVLLLDFRVYSISLARNLTMGKTYLRADCRIHCDSRKQVVFMVYAGLMSAFYALAIPTLYAALMLKQLQWQCGCTDPKSACTCHLEPVEAVQTKSVLL